jgi:hypothetical protein
MQQFARMLPGDPADTESRYIEAAVNGVLIGTQTEIRNRGRNLNTSSHG